MLEKQHVEKQLVLLQAQQNLGEGPLTGGSGLKAAKLTADVAILCQQVQLLQRQIDLPKKLAELEKLNGPGTR